MPNPGNWSDFKEIQITDRNRNTESQRGYGKSGFS